MSLCAQWDESFAYNLLFSTQFAYWLQALKDLFKGSHFIMQKKHARTKSEKSSDSLIKITKEYYNDHVITGDVEDRRRKLVIEIKTVLSELRLSD